MRNPTRRWQDIAPADAREIDLSKDLDITAPLNENGERCPWPWEPQQLVGVPIGMYHCGYCGAMVIARANASPGFGTILHSVMPQPDGYVSKGFRKKEHT
jgi:hypothetical protein